MFLAQLAEPNPSEEPADVLRSLALMANFAAQEITGHTDASRGVNELFDALANPSPHARTVVLAMLPESARSLCQAAADSNSIPLLPCTGTTPDPEALGWLIINLPLADNTHTMELSIVLDVELQPLPGDLAGAEAAEVVRALLEAAASLAPRYGRTVLQLWQQHSLTTNDALAPLFQDCGFEQALTQVESVLSLPLPGKTTDTKTLGFANEDFPEELLPSVAALYQQASADQPFGMLLVEEAPWDESRLQEATSHFRSLGTRNYHALALSPAGQVCALSEVWIHEGFSAEVAVQGLTYVLPEYRGQGLGEALKRRALAVLQESCPSVQRVYTAVATENAAMLALNRKLGSVPVGYASAWQRKLESS
ncbi:GNAT family N-acetyltransferase [Corynebacterium sp. H128]|uniref:GNAT family N-acetyltransferase n=1 Tax=Corynebacterium sp. H128 TaxID=3133427 RepID=UPI0030A0868B